MNNHHIGVIWNPAKLEKEDLRTALESNLAGKAASEVSWFETTKEDPGAQAAADALAAGADLLVVAGGDGTVRAVAEHLAQEGSEAHMGIIPSGTGNLLARNLGIPLGDQEAALARALEGDSVAVDVGWAQVELDGGSEKHAFLILAGIGVDAHMIDETNDDLKDKAGWVAYVEAMGRAVTAASATPMEITVDGEETLSQSAHSVILGNFGTVQGGLELIPDADGGDGKLDLLVLGDDSVTGWVDTLKNVAWDNGLKKLITKREDTIDSATTDRRQFQTVRITLEEPRMFQLDGEALGETSSVSVEVQPGALRVRR